MEQPKRMSTLVKIILALVALNVVLCVGVVAYLTLSRVARQEVESGTPVGRVATPTPTRTTTAGVGRTITATSTRPRPTNTARPAATTSAPATRPPAPAATATPLPTQPPQPTQAPQPTQPAATPAPGAIILNDPTLQDLLTALANAPAGQSVQANISQAALDAQIRGALGAGSDPTYQHQEIRLEDGRLLLFGRGQLQGITARVEVTARLYASNCRLAIDIERMRIGGLPAPRFLIDQVSASARQWADNYLATFDYCVEQVSIANQTLILAGRVR